MEFLNKDKIGKIWVKMMGPTKKDTRKIYIKLKERKKVVLTERRGCPPQ